MHELEICHVSQLSPTIGLTEGWGEGLVVWNMKNQRKGAGRTGFLNKIHKSQGWD